jgi:phenylpropionate dioxygenase-like ring-hydroxylating dioxygenase large terminal subunit
MEHGMLKGFWYIATQSRHVKRGKPLAVSLLDQPMVLLRDDSNTVHALEDRCPHRGVPLSHGTIEGQSIRCAFHGWQFSFSGNCVQVPASLTGEPPRPICVPSYPVQERDGWTWVYVGNRPDEKPSEEAPRLPTPPDGSPIMSCRMSVMTHVKQDLAVDSLVDPAHVPFVHHRFFRQQSVRRVKQKEFTRLPLGFRTVSEIPRLPDTFLFRILTPQLGPARASVDFILPGIHLETFEVGKRFASIMLIATPITTETTRMDITIGWNFMRWADPISWIPALVSRVTLGQDRRILEAQQEGHRTKSTMLFPGESDTMATWYRQLKRYHESLVAGTPTPHPIPEKTTLSWNT